MSYSKSYVGDKANDFAHSKKNDVFTGVNIILDNDMEVFVGENGNVLEVSLPICNSTEDAQAYGEYILSALEGYRYQPYESNGTLLNPALQLGDGVTVRSVYGGIYTRSTTMGRLAKADISAPFNEEVDSEYPFKSGEDHISYRKYKRLEANMESEFSIQADAISAKVSQLSPTGQTNFSWSLTADGHYWYNNGQPVMSITQDGLTVSGRIRAGRIGDSTNGFVISDTAIYNGKTSLTDTSNGIYLGTNGISLGDESAFDTTSESSSAFKVDAYGNAYVKNLTVRGNLYWQNNTSTTRYNTTASGGYGGISGGNNWTDTKTEYGHATDIYATSFHGSGTSYFNVVDVVALEYYYNQGTRYSPISFSLNGVTYHVFGWTS